MKNIAYVGVLAALLDVDMDVSCGRCSRRRSPSSRNSSARIWRRSISAIDYAVEHFDCPLPTRLRKLGEPLSDHIMIDGNTAAALGCVYAGATFGGLVPDHAVDLADGRLPVASASSSARTPRPAENRYCILQAEDELGAIGMTVGAGWSGARAFTSTSGPGISLMNEFLGFAYFAEIRLVLFDVQRAGPSTGLPTRTQQSDLLACAYASHGDTRHVLLFPAESGGVLPISRSPRSISPSGCRRRSSS